MTSKSGLFLVFCCFSATAGLASGVAITSFSGNGILTWTNAQTPSVCHVEWAPSLTSRWSCSWDSLSGILVTNPSCSVAVPMFYRVVCEPLALTNALALYLPMNGDASDKSTSHADGVVSGAALTNDRLERASCAYYFNGGNTQIYVPDRAALDVTNLTLAFWFKVSAFASANELVNKFGGGGNIAFGSEIHDQDHKVRFRVCSDGSNVSDCLSTTAAAVGVWYHFAGTYDGNVMRVYINGALENSLAKSGNIFNSSDALRIGTYGFYSWYFHGCIDEVLVWGRALSADEIHVLYANGGTLE